MKLFKAVAAMACAVALSGAAQAATYTDSSANYPDGWDSGTNGGEGFGAWSIATTSGGEGWVGCGIWDPAANDFQGTWAGKTQAFGMIGKGAGFSVKASRSFRAALAPNDSFQLDMGVNWDANIDGAHKGFVLTAGGKEILEINHGNYPGHIYVNNDDSFDVWNEAPNPEEGEVLYPMTWKFTAKDATTLTVSANSRKDGKNVYEHDFPVSTSAIDGFILQSVEQDNQNEDRRQSYYDNFVLDVAGELHDLVDIEFTAGDWYVDAATKHLTFTVKRSSSDGELEVKVNSNWEDFVPSTTANFADGEAEATFAVDATLQGAYNEATISLTAGGNTASGVIRGPAYKNSWEGGETWPDDEKNFWMNWEDNGIALAEDKIAIESDPAGALTLPDSWTWNMEEGGAYVASSFVANFSGLLVMKFDGVTMDTKEITVNEPGFTLSGPTAAKTGAEATYTLTGLFKDGFAPADISIDGGATVSPTHIDEVANGDEYPLTVTFGETAGTATLSVSSSAGFKTALEVTVTAPVDPSQFDDYVAYDEASLYDAGNLDYAALGAGQEGFQAWQNNYIDSDGETKFAGAVVVDSAPDAAALSDGKAFAIYANGADGAEIKLLRPFVNALAPGQALTLQVAPNYRDGEKSVRLSGSYDGTWYDRVVFSFDNGGYYYSIDYGDNVSLGWEYGTKAIAITLQYAADGSAYTLSFAREGDETVTVKDFTLPGAVDGIIFRSRNGGNGAENNVVFNRIAIEQVEEPIISRNIWWVAGENNPDHAGDFTFTIGASTTDIGEVALAIEPADGAASLSAESIDLTGVTEASFTVTLSAAVAGDKFTVTATPADTEVGALSYDIYPIDAWLHLKSDEGKWEFTTDDKEIWMFAEASPANYGTYELAITGDEGVLELSVDSVTVPGEGDEFGRAWFNVLIKGEGKATVYLKDYPDDEDKRWGFTITQGTDVELPAPVYVKGKGLAWDASILANGFVLRGTATLGESPDKDSWTDLVEDTDYVVEDGTVTVLYTSAYNYIAILKK